MQISELPGVGVEVTGVDIGALEAPQFAELHDLFSRHGLLFFRGQDIDETQHIDFARRWGQININRFFQAHSDYPEIAMVAKEPDQKINIGGDWHTDHSYDTEPALGSILVARELPESGGDTWFTSMYKAYEALSPGLRKTLARLRAVHSARHVFGSRQGQSYGDITQGRIGNAEAADELPDVVHPVVITHPLSGRKALYVNPGFTVGIEGWSAAESRALLDYLYAVAQDDAFVTRFHWERGSVAFWDNRATWHLARNDYQGQRRVMHRITLEGGPLAA